MLNGDEASWWFDCMQKLEDRTAALKSMYSRLQAQNERAQRWMNDEKHAFEELERENTLRSKTQLELQCQLNPNAQRVASVDAQIRALENQRNVM